LKRLNPEKLSVSLQPGVTLLAPIIPRSYTLTHSDVTAELFLTIGRKSAKEEIGAEKDELRAKWVFTDHQYKLYVYVNVGGPFEKSMIAKRYHVFVKELPLALEALRYGDQLFFKNHPPLDFAPIWVYFQSVDPVFNHREFFGGPEQYD